MTGIEAIGNLNMQQLGQQANCLEQALGMTANSTANSSALPSLATGSPDIQTLMLQACSINNSIAALKQALCQPCYPNNTFQNPGFPCFQPVARNYNTVFDYTSNPTLNGLFVGVEQLQAETQKWAAEQALHQQGAGNYNMQFGNLVQGITDNVLGQGNGHGNSTTGNDHGSGDKHAADPNDPYRDAPKGEAGAENLLMAAGLGTAGFLGPRLYAKHFYDNAYHSKLKGIDLVTEQYNARKFLLDPANYPADAAAAKSGTITPEFQKQLDAAGLKADEIDFDTKQVKSAQARKAFDHQNKIFENAESLRNGGRMVHTDPSLPMEVRTESHIKASALYKDMKTVDTMAKGVGEGKYMLRGRQAGRVLGPLFFLAALYPAIKEACS